MGIDGNRNGNIICTPRRRDHSCSQLVTSCNSYRLYYCTTMATQDPEMYLAILKASYDYEPQSEDEIAIKEDQLLLLIERVDEESVVL